MTWHTYWSWFWHDAIIGGIGSVIALAIGIPIMIWLDHRGRR